MIEAQWSASGVQLAEVADRPLPEGWARLRVTGCGICGSDLHIYRAMRSGAVAPGDFATPGHEMAGRIVEGPSGLADVDYAIEPLINCAGCTECLRGKTVLCEDFLLMGITTGGGLSEFVDVPPRLLHPVDSVVGAGLAPLAEPWAVAVRSIHQARLTEMDERVLVLGGGTIGALCGLAARGRVARVGVTCRYPHQAAIVRSFGLDALDASNADEVQAWVDNYAPGVVIETVGGEADTMTEAIAFARRGGRVVVVGVFESPRPTDYQQLVFKELEVVGSSMYGTVGSGSEFGASVRMMPSIVDELAALQTHRFALEDIEQAFATADDKSSQAIKVTIGADSA